MNSEFNVNQFNQGERLADNALIIRTSDHGEMGLSHGGMRQKAFVAYEEALRVPMVISNPKLFGSDDVNKSTYELATLIDIIPTMCDLIGITPPDDCRGTSLLPIVEEGKSVQDEILFTFDDTKSGSSTLPSSVKTCNRMRTIRTKDYKFTYYFDALGSYETQYELYDLNNDPTEYTNLAYDPKYIMIRAELYHKLKKLEREKLLINEDKTFSSMTWVDTNPNYQDYAYNQLSETADKSLNTY
jgi:arylsulfatase A-like enzyme